MKQNLVIFVLLLCAAAAQAQFAIGLKGGLQTQTKSPNDIIIGTGDEAFKFGVEDLKFGTQFGAWARIGGTVFIQPEVVFNSNRTDFRIGETSAGEIIKTEKYQHLDIPLLVGITAGPIRLHGGPVGHYFLSSKSELTDFDGYAEKWKQVTWGWQAGLSIGTGRISADIRYEGNFNKFGDQVTFFGDQYHFSNNPARLILALNFAIVK
ncbi:MAG: PorT family protein [Saprospiraceae bacterium]|nr:PorT family protein [Saprospiraceae bacterium]